MDARQHEKRGDASNHLRQHSPLGEQWWVLNRFLPLFNQLEEKKAREVELLRALREWYPDFPPGEAFASESPDFLVEDPGGQRVGLEFVEVLRQGARKNASPYREREAAEQRVLRRAEEIYYAKDPQGPVCVSLGWPPEPEVARSGPLPHPTEKLAGEVARLVREGAPRWAGGMDLELGPSELRGTLLDGVLKRLRARKTNYTSPEGRDSPWLSDIAYLPQTANAPDLEREISSKERNYSAYRKRCEEVWLIIALTGGPSSFEDIDQTVLAHHFQSSFDRVVAVCPGGSPGKRAVTLTGG